MIVYVKQWIIVKKKFVIEAFAVFLFLIDVNNETWYEKKTCQKIKQYDILNKVTKKT